MSQSLSALSCGLVLFCSCCFVIFALPSLCGIALGKRLISSKKGCFLPVHIIYMICIRFIVYICMNTHVRYIIRYSNVYKHECICICMCIGTYTCRCIICTCIMCTCILCTCIVYEYEHEYEHEYVYVYGQRIDMEQHNEVY